MANKIGGFTFEWSPTMQQPKSTEVAPAQKKSEESKPSPFANFTFGKPSEPGKIGGFSFGSSGTLKSTSNIFFCTYIIQSFVNINPFYKIQFNS